MNYQADFNEDKVLFTETPSKSPDLKHLQAAMFLDRPDPWKSKPRRSKPIPPEQWPLLLDNSLDLLGGFILTRTFGYIDGVTIWTFVRGHKASLTAYQNA